VIKYLREVYKYEVRGIYRVNGNIMPIQIVVTKELRDEDNIWLKSLCNDLDKEQMGRVMEEGSQKRKCGYLQAYMHMILQANIEIVKEVMMKQQKQTMEQVLEETGWTAILKERGIEKGKLEDARNFKLMGVSA
jgi:hypothetical protein